MNSNAISPENASSPYAGAGMGSSFTTWLMGSATSVITVIPLIYVWTIIPRRATVVARTLRADVPVAVYGPRGGGELRETHGSARMQLLRGNANFGAQTEL